MTHLSNDTGRAYEYAFISLLNEEISHIRPSKVDETSAFNAGKRAWDSIDSQEGENLKQGASSAFITLLDLEPRILEISDTPVVLQMQEDKMGVAGDVRDILLLREDIDWVIGLSLKHNHAAVKHSRLGPNLDFGNKWYGIPCSDQYWAAVKNVFEYLKVEKEKHSLWRDLPSKEEDVYLPILKAFLEEVSRATTLDQNVPSRLVQYLLGEFDFYKIIARDNLRSSIIQVFNLHGDLNQPAINQKPAIETPVCELPTKIKSFAIKSGSSNTAELIMDNGWEFKFRIHNASSRVEQSLKFDVSIVRMPRAVLTFECPWDTEFE